MFPVESFILATAIFPNTEMEHLDEKNWPAIADPDTRHILDINKSSMPRNNNNILRPWRAVSFGQHGHPNPYK